MIGQSQRSQVGTVQTRILLLAGALLGELLVASVHSYLPYYTNLVLLYAFPIIMVTFLGWRYGLFVAVFAAVLWLVVQSWNRPEEVNPEVHYWNAAVRALIFFALVGIVEFTNRLIASREQIHARLMARRALLATVSREMRDPLQRITLGVDTLAGPDVNPEGISAVKDAAAELLSLVDSMLELARLEAGKTTFSSDFSPASVVRGRIEAVQRQASSRAQVLSLEMDAGVPELVRGDESCLRFVLERLLREASAGSGPGALKLEVSFERPDLLRLWIRDTGNAPGRDGMSAHVAHELARMNGGYVRQVARNGGTAQEFAIRVEVL